MMNNSESSNSNSSTTLYSSITTSSSTSTTSLSATPKSTNELSPKNECFAKTARDQFFTDIIKNERNWSAKCIICEETVYDNIGVTSNANRHVKKNHQTEYNEWSQKLKQSEQQQPKLFDYISKKRRVSSPSKQSYPPSHPRQQQLHDAIVQNLIIEAGLPLSLVERPEFVKFMSTVDPKFKNISRRTLTRTTIPCLYRKMNDMLKEFCATSEYISLTLDIWTDRRTRSFFSITGHAIINMEFKSYVLCFLPLHGSHNSEKLLEYYNLTINEYQIQNKLCRIVTDNASNNIKAFEDLIIPGFESYFNDDNAPDSDDSGSDQSDNDSYDNATTYVPSSMSETLNVIEDSFDNLASKSALRLPCFAHTLQLVVQDRLKEATCIKQAIVKVSKTAKLAHSSISFAEKLENIGASVPKANKTRWNSQLYTVQKVLEIPSTQLNSMLTELKRKDLYLGLRDLSMLNEFVSLLTLFGEATTATQAEHSPSISLVGPSIVSIYYDLINERNNLTYTTTFCNALLSSLIARFGGLLKSLNIEFDIPIQKKGTYDLYEDPIFLVSSFLDGKFKLKWITESGLPEEKKIDVCTKIKNLVFDHCALLRNVANDVSVAETHEKTEEEEVISISNSKRKSLFSYLESDKKRKKIIDPFQYIRDEISRFVEDVGNHSMLVFRKSSVYKTLSQLAIKVLSVPATSAPVERVFSQSGFLLRQHRASMSKTTLQMLTMLKCNSHLG
ncbi:unnamed protein product [Rotaria sp. Silwood2]|nr:unnamed protein product [Rotaria sp. Silwood2]CAF3064983.1 unnamed protein product [Rotaria sp. Silwood2]CAF3369129.1 unnamed protein product [Rotaria sp. Silwood2]CAF3456563.1 unnamed protein product [Rotaria sp. Silwood2]CAF4411394.1 unnamed protein product [Rotaria sp. Silwood2]